MAHRTIEGASKCSSIARAVAVWAELVLDAENERAALAHVAGADVAHAHLDDTPPMNRDLIDAPGRAGREDLSLDLGASGFSMIGTGAGLLVGGTAFLTMGTGKGWYVRPMLEVGATATRAMDDGVGVYSAIRLDACGRAKLPLRLVLDPCLGTEIGLQSYIGSSILVISLGPSVALRAPVGSTWSCGGWRGSTPPPCSSIRGWTTSHSGPSSAAWSSGSRGVRSPARPGDRHVTGNGRSLDPFDILVAIGARKRLDAERVLPFLTPPTMSRQARPSKKLAVAPPLRPTLPPPARAGEVDPVSIAPARGRDVREGDLVAAPTESAGRAEAPTLPPPRASGVRSQRPLLQAAAVDEVTADLSRDPRYEED